MILSSIHDYFKVGVTDCKTGNLYISIRVRWIKILLLCEHNFLPFVSPVFIIEDTTCWMEGLQIHTYPPGHNRWLPEEYGGLNPQSGLSKETGQHTAASTVRKKYRDYRIYCYAKSISNLQQTLLYIEQLEQKGQIAVIRPSKN